MNVWIRMLAGPLVACGFAAGAGAEPVYNAEDVIRHFANVANLGAKRAICVGTKQECDKKSGASQPAQNGFNLTVTFDFGSAALTGPARENLQQFASALKDDRLARAKFRLEGHTDAIGDAQSNLTLSQKRARSVAKYLVELGVNPLQLTFSGFGETRPVLAEDPTHPSNRRVEAHLDIQ